MYLHALVWHFLHTTFSVISPSFLSFAPFPCISPLYSIFKTPGPKVCQILCTTTWFFTSEIVCSDVDHIGRVYRRYFWLLDLVPPHLLDRSLWTPSIGGVQSEFGSEYKAQGHGRRKNSLAHGAQSSVFRRHSSCYILHKSFSRTYNLRGAITLERFSHSCRK